MKSVKLIALITCTLSLHIYAQQAGDSIKTSIGKINLPKPYDSKSTTNKSKVIGWPADKTPKAPEGFTVTRFAQGLDNVRWIYILPNGDVLVAQANKTSLTKKITLIRDTDKNGTFEMQTTFLSDINMPLGMLLLGDIFYVAGTDGLWQYKYSKGMTKITEKGKKILDLPADGYNNHWTRNIIANKDKSKIYVSVGSGSNVAEHGIDHEKRRANILEINPDGSGEKIFAFGLRNPVGMALSPESGELWTAVNERDELGDDLVPDYMTSVKPGGFYGWPYSYFGKNIDPRIEQKDQKPDLVNRAIVPDVPLGSHTASLGLAFCTKESFPARYRNGAFIGQHGSWNRKELSGYKVVFVPFKDGKPSGPPEDFLTGFISDADKSEVFGRPVGVTEMEDGSMLVADDKAGIIWKVSVKK